MSKAMLVVEMPKNCEQCFACINIQYFMAMCVANGKELKVSELDLIDGGCPLRPLPPSSTESDYVRKKFFDESLGEDWMSYEEGWKDCLDEILGENNE